MKIIAISGLMNTGKGDIINDIMRELSSKGLSVIALQNVDRPINGKECQHDIDELIKKEIERDDYINTVACDVVLVNGGWYEGVAYAQYNFTKGYADNIELSKNITNKYDLIVHLSDQIEDTQDEYGSPILEMMIRCMNITGCNNVETFSNAKDDCHDIIDTVISYL